MAHVRSAWTRTVGLAAVALWPCAALAEPPRVVIDPGHGGTQTGAIGPGGQMEKAVALALCRKVKAELERTLSATVFLTHAEDGLVHLSERVDFANRKRPDVFVSIHANSMPTPKLRARTEGLETFFLSAEASGEEAKKTAERENAEAPRAFAPKEKGTLGLILADLQRAEAHADSSRLAYAVHQKLVGATEAVDRGVQQAPFYVLMGVEAPAILVEVGFISHPKESERLVSPEYQEKVARAIALGVGSFLAEVQARDRRPGKVAAPAAP